MNSNYYTHNDSDDFGSWEDDTFTLPAPAYLEDTNVAPSVSTEDMIDSKNKGYDQNDPTQLYRRHIHDFVTREIERAEKIDPSLVEILKAIVIGHWFNEELVIYLIERFSIKNIAEKDIWKWITGRTYVSKFKIPFLSTGEERYEVNQETRIIFSQYLTTEHTASYKNISLCLYEYHFSKLTLTRLEILKKSHSREMLFHLFVVDYEKAVDQWEYIFLGSLEAGNLDYSSNLLKILNERFDLLSNRAKQQFYRYRDVLINAYSDAGIDPQLLTIFSIEPVTSTQNISISPTGERFNSALTTDEIQAAPPASEDNAPSHDIPESAGKISRGQLIEGVISRTSPMEVFVDLGDGVEGVIPGRELDRMSRPMVENLKAGTPVTVYVVNPHDHQGNVLLSINRAVEEMDWKEAEGYQKSQKVYEGHIAGYNKGGLIVRFGRLRGFVPQSQISDDRRGLLSGDTPQERWENMVNNAIMVKVVEVDRSHNRLILSERAAAREARERRKESLVSKLGVGDVHTGRVVSLEDFGAFVDIGGAEGLVHLTELSWKHVTHPREVLKVNQQVKVEVISVDKKRNRIGLSIKRQETDPWDEVVTTYAIGQLVQGTVTKVTKFGAFARLVDAPDIEGLIHISELSDERVNHPKEVVQEDDKLTLRVVKIDVKNRRLGLSLKRVNSAEYLDMDWFKSPEPKEE